MNTLSRWIKHGWMEADDARRTLTPDGLARLEARVRDSETRHRGELRVCVQASLSLGELWRGVTPRDCAIELFSHLRVWDTEHDNGVLIYLLLADHRIEILADRGLTRHAPAEFWQHLVDQLSGALRSGRFEEGLNQAIDEVGALMRRHYPLTHERDANPNELPDAVIVM